MNGQNLFYALTQVVHNFGAVFVLASPLYPIVSGRLQLRNALWFALVGWSIQIISGLLFGLVSLHFYGQLPTLHGVAIVALAVKAVSAVSACVLIFISLREGAIRTDPRAVFTWRALTGLAIVALSSAAFLRWYS
ncbi:hypothetical protein [Castellaniella sp. UC4442_H9]